MRYKVTVMYDGYNYHGFQIQSNKPTIEEEIRKAISRIDSSSPRIYGSGRTDAFVHANGQVFHFDSQQKLKPHNWLKGLNRFLPVEIRIISVEETSDTFHARFSAVKKEYRYYIQFSENVFYRNYRLYQPRLDLKLMEEGLKFFLGTHDFSGLSSKQIPESRDRVKTIFKTEFNCYNDYVEIIFIGDGFLKYQVRKMVGLLIDIGLHRREVKDITEAIQSKDSCFATRIAPGWGLYLHKVYYKGEYDEN